MQCLLTDVRICIGYLTWPCDFEVQTSGKTQYNTTAIQNWVNMVACNVTYANVVKNELLKLQTVKWVLCFRLNARCPSLDKRNNRNIAPVECKKLRSDLTNQIVRCVCVCGKMGHPCLVLFYHTMTRLKIRVFARKIWTHITKINSLTADGTRVEQCN